MTTKESVARAVQALSAEPGLEGSIANIDIFIAEDDNDNEEADPSQTSTDSDGSKVCAICRQNRWWSAAVRIGGGLRRINIGGGLRWILHFTRDMHFAIWIVPRVPTRVAPSPL